MAGNRAPIEFTFDDDALKEIREKLGSLEKRAPSVMSNALNQTQTELKKHLQSQVLQSYSYKKRKLQKPRQQRAGRNRLQATLYYDRKDPGLEHFDSNPGATGSPRNTPGAQLAAKVRSDGGLKNIPRAFAMRSGSTDIIMRRDATSRRPLSRLFGTSEHNMVNHVWEEPETQRFTSAQLAQKLDDQINIQFLRKWGMSAKEAKNHLKGK